MATADLTPARFEKIVFALVSSYLAHYAVGTEWSFRFVGTYDIRLWVPREGYLSLRLVDWSRDYDTGIRTVAVLPGETKAFAIVENGVIIDETRGLPAAFSTALDRISAPLRAATQHDHDPVAV